MGYDMTRAGTAGDGDDYFRLNIWGMSTVRPLLAEYGVVRWAEMPPVPRAEEYHLDESFDFDESEDNLTPDQVAYRSAINLWREGHNGEAPGVPSYKLSSNDGWLVTPVEIRSGIGYADEQTPGWRGDLDHSEDGKLALEFAEWMEGSADGFHVW